MFIQFINYVYNKTYDKHYKNKINVEAGDSILHLKEHATFEVTLAWIQLRSCHSVSQFRLRRAAVSSSPNSLIDLIK